MRLYPVNFEITYASGRTEKITVKERCEEYIKDLNRAIELGSVSSYTKEDEQDRRNQKLSGVIKSH